MIEEIQAISEESGVPIDVVGRIFFKAKTLARRQRLTGSAYLKTVRELMANMVEGAKLSFVEPVIDVTSKPAHKRKSK